MLHQVHPYERPCASGSRHAVRQMCVRTHDLIYMYIRVEREGGGVGGHEYNTSTCAAESCETMNSDFAAALGFGYAKKRVHHLASCE